MGTYCTTTTLQTYLPGITFTSIGSLASASIDDAEAVIHHKLSRRYSMPFSPVPPIIRTISTRLSCYYLLTSLYTQDAANKNDWVDRWYNPSMEMLNELASGKHDLANTAGSILSDATDDYNIKSNTKDYQPVFDLDKDTDWEPDADRIDAIDRD